MGSSPLTRGKHSHLSCLSFCCGLIPAHAGKTATACTNATTWGAHPRSRGENPPQGSFIFHDWGSSPLTRGKQAGGGFDLTRGGLIPAHAGKTTPPGPQPPAKRAHPRSRGENSKANEHAGKVPGSSPLTRGKRAALTGVFPVTGLIPAHAGKTRPSLISTRKVRAHPRSRGENDEYAPPPLALDGSSPLTRGKPNPVPNIATKNGLIPAHAGKTTAVSTGGPTSRAHPRSRGENMTDHDSLFGSRGSSPLTRGKRVAVVSQDETGGLIPAHAGKTAVAVGPPELHGAHPRSRGENAFGGGDLGGELGSSPLTRGKPIPGHRVKAELRLIPAHAGKTAGGDCGCA